MKKSDLFITTIIFLIILIIIISPKIYIEAFSNGLIVWATVLIPTIFPLIFFTKLLTDMGILNSISNKFTFTNKLFKTPPISAYAFMISIMSGYPVGAKVVSDLYTNGYISKQDAYKTTTFTSNSGPMFIYGSVGIGMLVSRKLGLIMLFAHIIGAVLNGILYRNYKGFTKNNLINNSSLPQSNTNQNNYTFFVKIKNLFKHKLPNSSVLVKEEYAVKPKFSLGETMADSVMSILIIGGFICIFFIVIEIFNALNIFLPLAYFFNTITGIDAPVFMAIFNGVLEITHGCLDLTSLVLNDFTTTIICCGIITFGGIATMLQAFAFLQKIDMKFGFFIVQKITHTIFAVIVCTILLLIFGY